MEESSTLGELNMELDLLGQQPLMLNLYTQICLCYSFDDVSSHSAIISTLTNGLERLAASFPWMAGQVIHEGSGVYKIKPLERIPRLMVKDLRQDHTAPTMEGLKKASFPMSALDENIIAPRNTFTAAGGEPSESEVLIFQATFISGGLLLTINAAHNTMDMAGQGQVANLFSKACRNEPFTSEELLAGNLERRNLVPLFDDAWKEGSELAYQIVKPLSSSLSSQQAPQEPVKSSWAYFIFSPSSLTTLKSKATEALSSGFVSTDDTLTAFLWQSTIRARLPRLEPNTELTMARAVDVRQFLNISPRYTGLMQNMAYNTSTVQKILDEPLGSIALQLRASLNPETLGYNTRALATYFSRAQDKTAISFTATIDPPKDIMLSSWAKEGFYDLDFNLGLGKPEAVRRPRFPGIEGLFYLMPRALNGGSIAAALCLRDEDMERLKRDPEFITYGKYVG